MTSGRPGFSRNFSRNHSRPSRLVQIGKLLEHALGHLRPRPLDLLEPGQGRCESAHHGQIVLDRAGDAGILQLERDACGRPASRRRCTCPRLAAAKGVSENSLNSASGAAPRLACDGAVHQGPVHGRRLVAGSGKLLAELLGKQFFLLAHHLRQFERQTFEAGAGREEGLAAFLPFLFGGGLARAHGCVTRTIRPAGPPRPRGPAWTGAWTRSRDRDAASLADRSASGALSLMRGPARVSPGPRRPCAASGLFGFRPFRICYRPASAWPGFARPAPAVAEPAEAVPEPAPHAPNPGRTLPSVPRFISNGIRWRLTRNPTSSSACFSKGPPTTAVNRFTVLSMNWLRVLVVFRFVLEPVHHHAHVMAPQHFVDDEGPGRFRQFPLGLRVRDEGVHRLQIGLAHGRHFGPHQARRHESGVEGLLQEILLALVLADLEFQQGLQLFPQGIGGLLQQGGALLRAAVPS